MEQQTKYKIIQGGPQRVEPEINALAAKGFRPILMASFPGSLNEVTLYIVLERIAGS